MDLGKKIRILALVLLLGATGKTHSQKPSILFLLADGYNCDEFWPPWMAFQMAGFRVTVASPSGGALQAGHPDRNLDVQASESMDTVHLNRFSGLFLVGGHSPENLEKHAAALDFCRHFFETQKPVAAICHGPRLLEKAGLLKNNAGTLYFGIKDEVPERWVASGFGTRYDRPWVRDGLLLTARYPLDVEPFLEQCLNLFAAPGSQASGLPRQKVWVWDGAFSARENYIFRNSVFGPLGWDCIRFGKNKSPLNPGKGDQILVPHPESLTDSMTALLQHWNRNGIPVSLIAGTHSKKWAAFETLPLPVESGLQVWYRSREKTRNPSTPTPQETADTLWMLLDQGFDEETVLGIEALARIRKTTVIRVGEEKKVYSGLNGLRMKAERVFQELQPQGNGIWVAPGCLWPDSLSSRVRIEWIRRHLHGRHRFWIGGYDVLSVFRDKAFVGYKVASPDPTRWEFQKTAEFAEGHLRETRPNVITFKGPVALPDLNKAW
jgi:protease I